MAPKHDTDCEHHNPRDIQSTTFVDYKLVTQEDESVPSVTMQNKDHTDIIDELSAMLRPPDHLRSSIPESTLHRISKMVMKEAVEDKKMDLMQSSTKISENDVDILDLINTSQLYGLINGSIDKYNHCNTVQGFINDMAGNTNVLTMVHNSNEVADMEQDEINDLDEDLRHLRYGLGDNINDDDNKNSQDNTNLADNGLKSQNTMGAHILEEK